MAIYREQAVENRRRLEALQRQVERQTVLVERLLAYLASSRPGLPTWHPPTDFLLVYEVLISTVEGFEQRVSRFLRKWLGLPQSLSNLALYGQSNKLKLPISSMNEEFMVTRTREVLQYWESCDPKISQAGIYVRTGWKGRVAVDAAESRLRQRVLVGAVSRGRAPQHLATTRHRGMTGGHSSRIRWECQLRRSKQAGWLGCGSWEPGQDLSKVSWASLLAVPKVRL